MYHTRSASVWSYLLKIALQMHTAPARLSDFVAKIFAAAKSFAGFAETANNFAAYVGIIISTQTIISTVAFNLMPTRLIRK